MKLQEAISKCLEFYGDNVPATVSAYITYFPKGLSRQVLKNKFGLTTGQFLKLLGSSYAEPESTLSKFLKGCQDRGLLVLDKPTEMTKSTKARVSCKACGLEFETYWDTLSQTKYGCRSCAGNQKLSERPNFLQRKADKVNSIVLSVPENNHDKVKLQCKTCKETYWVTTSHLTNPSTDNTASCPNCRISDRRVTYEGITFGSQFERECYKLLKHLKPKLQQRYSKSFDTARQWTCDFVIDNYWIEVTSYTKYSQGYSNYSSNIEGKKSLVEAEGKSFIYLTSLREVSDFIDKI